MGRFAVIDTETNWNDKVMSIGTVIADTESFAMVDAKYHILTPEYLAGGMYENTLFANSKIVPIITDRASVIKDLTDWFNRHRVNSIFAYNACFDRNHLPELRHYNWYDIMRLAAYRQYNKRIPSTALCCSTGRLKSGYGVEAMLRLLSDDCCYQETHNAVFDAMDELQIMRLLGYSLGNYIQLQ